MDHSDIVGGSSAARVLNCPASIQLARKAPPSEPSPDAIVGTALHEAISLVMDGVHEPEDLLGVEFQGVIIDDELYREKLMLALVEFDALDNELGGIEYAVETRVGFNGEILKGVFGTADILGDAGDRLLVLDWKFGDGVLVPAEDNKQLLFYAAAALDQGVWPFVGEPADDLPVELVIVQPARGLEHPMSRWMTSVGRLRRYKVELELAVKAGLRGDEEPRRGDWCRWCAAKPFCPAWINDARRLALLKPDDITPEEIGELLELARAVPEWAKAVEARAKEIVDAGQPIPGWKLVQKKGRRRWKDVDAVLQFLRRRRLVRAAMKMEPPSPAQLERLLKARGEELPADMVETPVSGVSLVPETDPRPAVMSGRAALAAVGQKLKR